MDEEVLDSPLDLSIPRSDAALLSNAGGLQSNNSFSWSGMAEALSWSDQLLRVKSVMTIAQLNQDWKDEEEVQEEDDQQPWRFDGQFEAFKPLEEEVEDVVGEEGVTIAESRSLEVGQEFHIFGGEEERSPVATKQFQERAEDIGKPGLRAIPPSDAVGGEESSPVCLEECSVELEAVFPASQVSDQSVGPADCSVGYVGDATVQDNTLSHIADAEGELPAHHEDLSIHNTGGQQQEQTNDSNGSAKLTICTNQPTNICQMLSFEETSQERPSANICQPLGAECQAVLAPLAQLVESLDSREELEVTQVTLLSSPGNMVDGQSLPNIPLKEEFESLVDGLALKDLVVIECQTPCEQVGHDQLLQGEEDSSDLQGGGNTLAEQVGHGLSRSELLGIDLFKRKVSSDSVSISEVSGELAEKRTLETVLVQCWKCS